MLFAACATDATEDVAIRTPETLEVSFEEDSRIQLQNGKTVWTEGDLVSVFYRSDANQRWKFQGNTGDRSGKLKCVSSYTSTTKLPKVVVVYPYNENYYINPQSCNVEATLPATQTYIANSYGLDGNIMVSSSEYNQVYLRSVCGWLKIQLTGADQTVEKITLKGNNGEQVAGQLYIDTTDASVILAENMVESDDNGLGGMLEFDETILTEVTLNCSGVTLGKNATAFYIALPPQQFSKGLTIEIEDTEGYVMEQSTDKVVTVERNQILPMAAFEFINPATPTTPTPSTNEIWYTATGKVEPTFDDHLTFGANVVSNVWDSESKRGIITFDGDVTMIGDDAFNNCDKLTTVTLPEGVISIGNNAFYGCDGLTEFTIPDSVTSIGSSAFESCNLLESVTIGNSVTSIGNYAFSSCSSLTSVTIPDSVTSIGNYAFYSCSSLTSITIPNSVTSIGYQAFSSCSSLTSVTIPDSVTSIGNYAFYGCSSLTSVTIGDSVTSIEEGAFYDCSSLTSVTIPNSVTRIGWGAFYDCSSLASIDIPNSVTEIGSYAFKSCSSLTSITIPDSVTSIESYAFYSCSSLTSVTIGSRVSSIGNYAFRNCSSLKEVYCKPFTPPTLGSDVFSNNAPGRKIYVPTASVNTYKRAKIWTTNYYSVIVGYDF